MNEPYPEHSDPSLWDSVKGASGVPTEPPNTLPEIPSASLDDHVEMIASEITRFCDEFSDSLSHSVIDELQNLIGRAETSILRLAHDSGLVEATAQGKEIDIQTAWSRVRAYRRGLQSEVLEPLTRHLGNLDAGQRIDAMFRRLISQMSQLEERVPENLVRVEPPDLYQSAVGDNPYIGLRKLAVRIQRRIIRAGGETDRVQRIMLRTLVRAHAGIMIPSLVQPRVARGVQEIGLAVARIERELSRLVHELLGAEVELDRSVYHLPVSIGLQFPEQSEILRSSEDTVNSPDRFGTGSDEETKPHQAILDTIRTANSRLVQALGDARNLTLKGWIAGFSGTVILALDGFRRDVVRSDTFMVANVLRKGSANASEVDSGPRFTLPDRWIAWHRETTSRLNFLISLSVLRDSLTKLQTAAVDGAFGIGLMPTAEAHTKTASELRRLRSQADALFENGFDRLGIASVMTSINAIYVESVKHVETYIIGFMEDQMLDEALAGAHEEVLTRLKSLTDNLPDNSTLHPLVDEDEDKIDLSYDQRTIDLRLIAVQAIEDPFSIDLNTASQSLIDHAGRVRTADAEILAIVRFNLGAALEELEEGRAARGKDSVQKAFDAARELTLNGLARSADALLAERDNLTPVGQEVMREYFQAFRDAWEHIHNHARAESQVQKALVSARTIFDETSRSFVDRAKARLEELRARTRKITRLGKRKAGVLVRLGQEAVGVKLVQEAALQETMEALTAMDDIIDGAPLVYRRLFSFHPLTDADFLEGRHDDKRRLVMHVQAWRKGIPQAFLVTGSPSAGLTSFLNVMSRTVLRQFEVRRLEFLKRIHDERELTSLLVDTLQIENDDSSRPSTLTELTSLLLSRPISEEPLVCIVEHLEHLFLRAIGGSRLVREFLTMVSRTDSRLIWILTIADFGWQLIEKSEPNAASLVARHELTPLDRAILEKLILKRHSRSGLKIEFVPPPDPNPILARRLKRAGSVDESQRIISEVFFDRLHAECGQNIMLALFYWISSVSLNEEETGMVVKPFNPMKFGFLAGFSLQQSLALKALLEHESLTIDEFAAVDSCSLEAGIELFESLGNALLIEPVTGGSRPGRFDFISVEQGVSYRIRPLIVYPIIQYLKGKNIVHL